MDTWDARPRAGTPRTSAASPLDQSSRPTCSFPPTRHVWRPVWCWILPLVTFHAHTWWCSCGAWISLLRNVRRNQSMPGGRSRPMDLRGSPLQASFVEGETARARFGAPIPFRNGARGGSEGRTVVPVLDGWRFDWSQDHAKKKCAMAHVYQVMEEFTRCDDVNDPLNTLPSRCDGQRQTR